MIIKRYIFALSLAVSICASGQSIIMPVTNPVYGFLEAMSVKGIITFNEFLHPLTRNEISFYLQALRERQAELTAVEREQLDFHSREFHAELSTKAGVESKDVSPSFFHSSAEDRPRFFYFRGDRMQLSVSPLAGVTMEKKFGETRSKIWNGFTVFGNVREHFGFHVDFRDNTVRFKEHQDLPDLYEPATGPIQLKSSATHYEHSETHGSFLFSTEWMMFGGLKENMRLGSGYNSNIILSSKAPTFPAIYLKINPLPWLQFYYMHGWLLSRVHDSAASYTSQIAGRPRNIDRPKYFAMHALQINPWKNLAYTFGETIVYSDQSPYWGYLMPFLFYRSVDHMFEGNTGENTGNNGSFFLDIKYWPVPKVRLSSAVFVDELSLSNLLNNKNGRNQVAFTMGASLYDIVIPRLLFKAEYTAIQPWVYSNFVQTQTYTNSGYLMGHYIGQNSDQLFLSAEYQLFANLLLQAQVIKTRQGSFGPVENQYDETGEEFLYGLLREETSFGFSAQYQYTHDATAKVYFNISNVSDEDAFRTPDWRKGSLNKFGLSISYGL